MSQSCSFSPYLALVKILSHLPFVVVSLSPSSYVPLSVSLAPSLINLSLDLPPLSSLVWVPVTIPLSLGIYRTIPLYLQFPRPFTLYSILINPSFPSFSCTDPLCVYLAQSTSIYLLIRPTPFLFCLFNSTYLNLFYLAKSNFNSALLLASLFSPFHFMYISVWPQGQIPRHSINPCDTIKLIVFMI